MRERTAAEFNEVTRSWLTHDNVDQRMNYMGMKGRISLASLLAHMHTIAPGVQPEDMMLNWATVTWVDAATEDEKVERVEADRRSVERREAWERLKYEELRAKFGDA